MDKCEKISQSVKKIHTFKNAEFVSNGIVALPILA